MRHNVIILLLLSLLVAPARAQSGPQLTQSVVTGGGGVSAQGSVRVEGTVGQGVVGTSAGGAFALDGGFDVTFHAVNGPPTANGQSVTTDENTPVAITLTGADEETPAGGLVFTVTAQPAHGALGGTAPGLTYTPAGGYVGPDGFKFTVTDTGDGAAPPLTNAEATVSVNVIRLPAVSARDARVAEPASGQAQMLFTLTLDRAPTAPVSVDFDTPAGPAGAGAATAGGDYTTTDGTATFQPGQRVQTVAVPVLHDNAAEPDETFLLRLSNASGGHVADGEAAGTIAAANPAGAILISELRTFGPGEANAPEDDFVEFYNNTDSPVTVSTGDGSPGWGLFKSGSDCDASPVLVGTIPNDTVIPARGHYLFVGPAYSLGSYAAGDSTLTADIESNTNVALFSTSDVAHVSSVTRLDATGFGGSATNNCALLREGNSLGALNASLGALGQHSFFRKLCDFVPGVGCWTDGTPKDANDNAADFAFGDTEATSAGAGRRLAAPGPEGLSSPVKRDAQIMVALLDASAPAAAAPNRVRDLTPDPTSNFTFGTLSIRRRVVNHTGADVTRLRFRISEVTTFPVPPGTADLRARSSPQFTALVNDPATCGAKQPPTAAPCTVTVEGTSPEQPPDQPNGGGLNSSLAVGSVTLATPLSDGQSVNVQFLLGLQRTGTFRFYVIVEALP